MKFPEGIEENFRFMVLEVTKQVENTQKALNTQDQGLIARIEARDDYIDNLKSVIENKCFSSILVCGTADKRALDFNRAVNIVSANLERIADHAVNIAMQIQYLTDPNFLKRYEYKAFFAEITRTLRLVARALYSQDIAMAFRICRSEVALDSLFKTTFDQLLGHLRQGESPENCLTAHNIFRYLERMGDCLLNIGEAIVFSAVGEKFKIHQYEALQETLADLGENAPITDGEFHSIWGTRSGCRIGKVEGKRRNVRAAGVLFKEGNAEKLSKEAENIARWQSVQPGLPPMIQSFHRDGESASLLMEYLGGCTLQEVILTAAEDVLENAMFLLKETVRGLWLDTKSDIPTSGNYIGQLRTRMDDVLRMHPALNFGRAEFLGHKMASFDDLVDACLKVDKAVKAPFTVFIHGDFNVNNIVYNHKEQRLHYIDLHRSKDADFVQDVSVFLLSNFRLPVMDVILRQRLNRVISEFLAFAREFAAEVKDHTFETRIGLGLARSFITSSRFEFNQRFAKEMFLRGVFLLQKIIRHGQQGGAWPDFTLPPDVLNF